jgi:DNA-binding LytR/AlgR family response regulator
MLSQPSGVTLPVKEGATTVFLPVESVLWIESANKYAILHTSKQSYLIRRTIRNLVDQLKSESFLRIHRTAVIRKSAIRSVRPLFHGDQSVLLRDGTVLTLSRRYRRMFFAEMAQTSKAESSLRQVSAGVGIRAGQSPTDPIRELPPSAYATGNGFRERLAS